MKKKVIGILICIGLILAVLPVSGIIDYDTGYYWQIHTDNNRTSLTESKTVMGSGLRANLPPFQPTAIEPVNASTNVSINVDLNWTGGDPDGDPVTYDVYFGDISSPPNVASNQTATTYDPGIMNYNTIYYWKIIAWDNNSAFNESPIWVFTTELEQNHPPYQPNNPNPANDSIDVYFDMDLSWTGGDPDGDPVTYDVFFGNISSPPQVSINQTATTYDPGIMNYNTIYYWKIIAWDNNSAFNESPIWVFTTELEQNHPPYQPNNPNPANGSTGVRLDVVLNWTCSDPDGDPLTYDVYFGTNSTPPEVVNNQTATVYAPGLLNNNTTYYWKIIAWDNNSAFNESPLWDFTTGINHPPYQPTNPSPSNGSSGVDINVDISWTGGDPDPGDTVTYDVYFGINSSSLPIVSNNQSASSYDPGTLNNVETYYWQIVAWDDFGASAESPMWEFTTAGNQPPYPPSIISGPAFGGPGIDHSFSAITSDPEGDDVYYMWDWGDGNFSEWLGPFDITNPVVTSYTWNESGVYGIKVKAKDIHDEEGDWSEIFNVSISKQIWIENLKPGFIYFHILTFENSYLYLFAFEKLGITGMISTGSSLFVNATVTEAVDSVRFDAFQILWNMSTEEWDDDMSDGANAYIPLTFGLFRITAYAYDADGNMIDTDIVDYLLLFLRSSSGGGMVGKVRQRLANRLLK